MQQISSEHATRFARCMTCLKGKSRNWMMPSASRIKLNGSLFYQRLFIWEDCGRRKVLQIPLKTCGRKFIDIWGAEYRFDSDQSVFKSRLSISINIHGSAIAYIGALFNWWSFDCSPWYRHNWTAHKSSRLLASRSKNYSKFLEKMEQRVFDISARHNKVDSRAK